MNQINGIGEVNWMGTACGKVTIKDQEKKGHRQVRNFSNQIDRILREIELGFW